MKINGFVNIFYCFVILLAKESVCFLIFFFQPAFFIWEKQKKKVAPRLDQPYPCKVSHVALAVRWLHGVCISNWLCTIPPTPPPLSLPTSILLLLCVCIWVHCLLVHTPRPSGPCRWLPLISKSVCLQPPIPPFRLGKFTFSSVKSTDFRKKMSKIQDVDPNYVF